MNSRYKWLADELMCSGHSSSLYDKKKNTLLQSLPVTNQLAEKNNKMT